MKAPVKKFGRSALCTASCPDSARTGYPGAFQWYDKKHGLWRWVLVGGIGARLADKQWVKGHAKAAEKIVQRQADGTPRIPIGTPFRFTFVERWIRVRRPRKGWRPVIRYTVEARKQGNARRKCAATQKR